MRRLNLNQSEFEPDTLTMSTVFKNARLFLPSPEPHLSDDKAILVIREAMIVYIGPENEAHKSLQIDGARVLDMEGKIIAPAFFDGHMHLLLHGSSILKINLEPCKNLHDIRTAIRIGAAARPNASYLFCRGYMHHMLSSEPTASMIDDLDDRPIFINSRDLHSTWCNTAALHKLDVWNRPDPEGGIIHRDSFGNPTGLLSEMAAIKIAWPYENKITSFGEKMSQSRAAIASHTANGYTSLIELATDEEIWSCMIQLHKEGAPIRMVAHWLVTPSQDITDSLRQVDRAIDLYQQFNAQTSPDCRIAGIKIMLDGTVDACTAAVSKKYPLTNSYHEPSWTMEHLKAVVSWADQAHLQCAIHAIGDVAVRVAIDAVQSCGTPGSRHRIEHLELTSPNDAKRLGELGITASIQPAHADPVILKQWPELLGHDLCNRAFAYSDFYDAGALVSIGTDAPTAPTHPLQNMYVATTRRSACEQHTTEHQPVNPQFVLPLSVAMAAAAQGTAKSCFAENRVGTLEVGKLADFVVLSMKWDANDLLSGTVEETWFAGRQVCRMNTD